MGILEKSPRCSHLRRAEGEMSCVGNNAPIQRVGALEQSKLFTLGTWLVLDRFNINDDMLGTIVSTVDLDVDGSWVEEVGRYAPLGDSRRKDGTKETMALEYIESTKRVREFLYNRTQRFDTKNLEICVCVKPIQIITPDKYSV
jgi:ribosomal protein S16